MESPPIVCAVDDRYVGPLCVFMQSLSVAQSGRPLRLIVLHEDLSKDGRQRILFHAGRLGLRAELRTGQVDPRYPVSMWGTSTVYLRLALDEILPDIPVVLYMDADIIVRRDLSPLLNQPMDGLPLAAVRDPLNPTLGSGLAVGLPGWQALGLPGTREYFNSGVMLIDLPECGRRGIFDAGRRFAVDKPEHILFWEQDALNWAVADDWFRLDRCWNTFPASVLPELYQNWTYDADDILPFSRLLEDEATAAVLHFAGPVKPWTTEYPAGPSRDLYVSYMKMVAEHDR